MSVIRSAGPPQGADSGGSAAAQPQVFGDQTMPPGGASRWSALALVLPALIVVGLFFVVPLLLSAVGAFRAADGSFTLAHFDKSLDLYSRDLIFTVAIVALSTVLIALVAIAI